MENNNFLKLYILTLIKKFACIQIIPNQPGEFLSSFRHCTVFPFFSTLAQPSPGNSITLELLPHLTNLTGERMPGSSRKAAAWLPILVDFNRHDLDSKRRIAG
jgi:hypothetical protein